MKIDQAVEYEMKYWQGKRWKPYDRARDMVAMFGERPAGKVMADVGCGPRGGIFNEVVADEMYAVDPLWPRYEKDGLARLPEGVTAVVGTAEGFMLPSRADVVFCVNALDHSGDIRAGVENMMRNLAPGGRLFLHVHLRTIEQLNVGHKMALDERTMDGMLAGYEVLERRVETACPLDRKPYRSYIAKARCR